MEVLRFIFSSFWVWLGAVVLIAAAGEAVAGIIKAIRQPRKITVHRAGDIVREHSVKNGTVTFLYELDDSGKLVHIVAAQRHKRREEPEQSRGVKMIFEDESGQLPPEFVNFIRRRFV